MVRVGNVPTVSAYRGNIGQRMMQVGERLEGISQEFESKQKKELAEAKKMYAQGLNIDLYNNINELRNDPKLSSNPQGLASAMDKVLEKTLADVDDDDVKLDVMVDYQLKKGTYINHAQAEFNRIQRERARSYAYDSVYANIDSMGMSFANALTGNYTEDDIANYQHSLEKIKRNINATNPDGTYVFSDAQRRAMARDADSSYLNGFKAIYEQLDDRQRQAITNKLDADYFNISPKNKDFQYKGNIDLASRPIYRNEDGSVSSEKSMSFWDDTEKKEIIVPTIRTEDGKRVDMTPDEARRWYYKTGEHLGKYDTAEEADKAATLIHERGEGIPLEEIVGEDSYKDIKNYAKKYNQELLNQRIKEDKYQANLASYEFLHNPTDAGLKKAFELNPNMSEKTKEEYRKRLENTPAYKEDQKTYYVDMVVAEDEIKNFINKDFKNDDERFYELANVIGKIDKSANKGNLEKEDVDGLKKMLLTASMDKQVSDNIKQFDAYSKMFWSQMFAPRPYTKMKDLLKKSKRKFINFKYPEVEDKNVGDTLNVRGIAYKIISLDPVPTLEPVE